MTTPSRINPFLLALESYRRTWRGIDTILRFSWFAVLMLSLLGRVMAGAAPGLEEGEVTPGNIPPGTLGALVVLAFAGAVLHAMIAVAWHRALLLGEHHEGRRIYLRVGGRECLYGVVGMFLFAFLFMGASMVPLAFGSAGGNPLAHAVVVIAGPLLALFILARSILVLPSVALGRGPDLVMSWQATQRNGMRIAAALFLVGLPLVLAEIALLQLVENMAGRDGGHLVNLAVSFVSMIVMVLIVSTVVTAISLLYERLVDTGRNPSLTSGH